MKAAEAAETVVRPGRRLVAGLWATALVFAAAGYAWTGSPGFISGNVPIGAAAAPSQDSSAVAAEFETAVERLARQLEERPENARGWLMLARSYVLMGRLPQALPAFEKALALDAHNAGLLVDHADALALTNDRNFAGRPMLLLERALKIEPGNLKGLALAGTAAFARKDYPSAVRHWEMLVAAAPPESPLRERVQGGIDEARSLGAMAPGASTATAVASSGIGVSGTVRLAASVAAQAAPTDTVFVLARAAEGPRMPLAVVRAQVKDLPLAFRLDDAMAMAPQMRLSQFPKIVIDARVSKSGQAQPSPGDLAGRSASIANNVSGVVVEINEVVKN